MAQFSLDACDVRITAGRPDFVRHFNFSASHNQQSNVAFIDAISVDRRHICVCENFYIHMNEEAKPLRDLAFRLFDKFGRLRPEFVENERKRGTGVWGRELDEGVLLYVTSVRVAPEVSGVCRAYCQVVDTSSDLDTVQEARGRVVPLGGARTVQVCTPWNVPRRLAFSYGGSAGREV